jgi:tRNA A-37 threonylcarbamoyl transferase component Bud32
MAQELQGKLVGGWRIGELLGNGGSALVLRAERNDREAALKVIDPELEAKYGKDQQETRVSYEAKLVGRRHPHLVQIFDGGRCSETGLLFVVMEYLPFRNLDEVAGQVPPTKIAQIVDQIGQAARFLEELGICHRDIKPENIAITPDFERAILLDLGILTPMEPEDGQDAGTGDNFIGTVRYSPPEFVWRREEGSTEEYRAITFYQIGAVLHDLIMGRRIFHDVAGPMAALIHSVTHDYPEIDALNVDQRLVNLARDCLQKDWKTRLRLIDWTSFEIAATPTTTNARERVKAVLAGAAGTCAEAASRFRPNRFLLSTIGRSLRDQMRTVCLRNGDFPRAAVDFCVLADKTEVWAEFDASPIHQLQQGVRITVSATPIDDQSSIVTATGSWGRPSGEAEWARVATLRTSVADISDQFEQLIYELIANALAHPGAPAGTPIRLS